MLKRSAVRAAIYARGTIGEAAGAVAVACGAVPTAGRFVSSQPKRVVYDPAEAAPSFADLPLYRGILKHKEIGRLFDIDDPFYRCHQARNGVTTQIAGKNYVNFASYDYLGLNQHPAIVEAAKTAIDNLGTSVSASRIVAGERTIHGALERSLADFYGVEAAITFVSGHATNVSTISTLMTADDLILYDDLSHNSLIVGVRLSGATAYAFKHNDAEALEALLLEHRPFHKRALIVAEGLYSMDGDVGDLPSLVALKEKYGAWLMIDEAHGLGVLGETGRGSAEHYDIDPKRVDIWMGTLSKALASCGGYIAGRQELIDILKYQAPGLVYSVGLSPPLTAAATRSLELLKAEPERVARLRSNGKLFLSLARAAGMDTATSEGHAVVSVIVGDLVNAGRLADRMLARGINVLPIIYPAVPIKAARLRFFITSEHTPTQIREAVRTMREEMDGLGKRPRQKQAA
ncbi:MAG TPA: aminotransferase class I/II-fold pyridoxal phosphate-dependent enzyme [Hyphomicrobiaceae bacterium]|nr:aminotransferase class I/II-fold pyridoxal phosphate-dependent enzyme [Hyphomicrobiaceae bacterium]